LNTFQYHWQTESEEPSKRSWFHSHFIFSAADALLLFASLFYYA